MTKLWDNVPIIGWSGVRSQCRNSCWRRNRWTQHNSPRFSASGIKPGNFFLSGSGSQRLAKIDDYGFAKAFDAAGLSGLTMTGAVAGTAPFMPRQQVINFKYSKPEVDVWGDGSFSVQYAHRTIDTGFSPGEDPWAILLKERPVPIRKRDSAIPKKLAEVIDEALMTILRLPSRPQWSLNER